VEVVASLSQGRTAAAQCGLFTHKSVPVIFEPPCIMRQENSCIKYLSSIPSSHQLQEVWVRLSSNSSTGEMLLLVPFFKNMPGLIN